MAWSWLGYTADSSTVPNKAMRIFYAKDHGNAPRLLFLSSSHDSPRALGKRLGTSQGYTDRYSNIHGFLFNLKKKTLYIS